MSPVHIGCDDVYEPTSFVIDERKNALIEFDPMGLIKSLSPRDRQEFTRICREGSISSIIKMYDFISRKQVKGREIEIANELVAHYKKVKSLSTNNERSIKQELNQFTISRTVYNPHTNLPYIPGSSVKGAIRTAYLAKLAMDMGISKCWNTYLQRNELETDQNKYQFIGKKQVARRLEKDLLDGDFKTDPFRMIKPSDFLPIGEIRTKIVYAVNKKKKPSRFDARGPFQIVEIIKEGTVFEGTIHIQQPQLSSGIKNPIHSKELLTSVHDFYKKIVNDEDDVTHNINAGHTTVNRIVGKFNDKQRGISAILLRIGRHSGVEAVTIEGNRYIKIIQSREQTPKFLDHATTIWLASESSKPNSNNGLVPFGWAVMEIVP